MIKSITITNGIKRFSVSINLSSDSTPSKNTISVRTAIAMKIYANVSRILYSLILTINSVKAAIGTV